MTNSCSTFALYIRTPSLFCVPSYTAACRLKFVAEESCPGDGKELIKQEQKELPRALSRTLEGVDAAGRRGQLQTLEAP